MMGLAWAVAGWFAHRWWENRKRKSAPTPIGTWQGRLTANMATAGAISLEAEISEPDPGTGERKFIKAGKPDTRPVRWTSTFAGHKDGQLTVRFETPCEARDAMRKCNIQDEFEIQIFRTKVEPPNPNPLPMPVSSFTPFGPPMGSTGGMS